MIWSRSARRELERLNECYAELSPDLPLTRTLPIETELRKLGEFPQLGSVVQDSQSRKWRLRRTPYLLFYRVMRDGICILSVRHVRSDWRSRA